MSTYLGIIQICWYQIYGENLKGSMAEVRPSGLLKLFKRYIPLASRIPINYWVGMDVTTMKMPRESLVYKPLMYHRNPYINIIISLENIFEFKIVVSP